LSIHLYASFQNFFILTIQQEYKNSFLNIKDLRIESSCSAAFKPSLLTKSTTWPVQKLTDSRSKVNQRAQRIRKYVRVLICRSDEEDGSFQQAEPLG